MFHPGSRGYFRETEREHPFIDKALGFAKLAGIIAAGTAISRPLLSTYGGPLLRWLGNNVDRIDFTGQYGSSPGNFLTFGAGRDTRALHDVADAVRTAVSDRKLHAERLSAAEAAIRPHLTAESQNLLSTSSDSLKYLRSLLEPFAKADEPHELSRKFLTRRGIQEFQNSAALRNIHFEDRDATATLLQKLKGVAVDIKRQGFEITDAEVADAVSAGDNPEHILRSLRAIVERERRASTVFGKALGFPKDSHITWAHISQDTAQSRDLRGRIEKHLAATGYKTLGEARTETPFLDAAQAELEQSIQKLFPGNFASMNSALELAKSSSVGFAVDKYGELVPLGVLKQAKHAVLDKVTSELQIPLLPPFFSVPFSLFKFSKPIQDPVKILGKIAGLPELKKAGLLPLDLSDDAMGVMVGRHLLTIDGTAEDTTIRLLDSFSVQAFDTAASKHLSRFHQIRSLEPEGLVDRLQQQVQQKGVLGGIRSFITERESSTFSLLDRAVVASGRGPKWMPGSYDVEHRPGLGMVAHYRHQKLLPFLHKHFGDKLGIDPVAELRYLFEHPDLFENPIYADDIADSITHTVREAAKTRVDIGNVLMDLAKMTDNPDFYFAEDTGKVVRQLLAAGGSARDLQDIIFSPAYGSESIASDTTKLRQAFPVGMYGTINRIADKPERLGAITVGEVGRLNSLKSVFTGQTGISLEMQRLQEGLLEHVVLARGAGKAISLSGGEEGLIAVGKLAGEFEASDSAAGAFKSHPFIRALDNIGINSAQDQLEIVKSIFPTRGTDQVFNYRQLGYIGTALLNNEELISLGRNNKYANAKIVDIIGRHLEEIPEAYQGFSAEIADMGREFRLTTKNQRMRNAAIRGGVIETLEERFGLLGKTFYPEPFALNPAALGDSVVLPTSAPEILDFIESPFSALKSLGARWGGVPEYLKGMVDPHSPTGQFGMVSQILYQMPERIAEEIGIGLSAQDSYTVMRSTLAYYGKRVLPVMAAWEVYKNFNANMHELGLPGIDDMGANLVANVNLWGAYFKDVFHVTPLLKNVANGLPGLDQVMHPRSYDEYKDYLFHGDEEVRRNRGWLIGSKQSIFGSNTKYYRPNFYRRWKSHWTELSGIADPSHSLIPSPLHPLSPLAAIFDPNHWEREHRYDRPYVGEGWPGRSAESSDSYLYPTSEGTGDFLAVGAFGGDFPSSMTEGAAGQGVGGSGASAGNVGAAGGTFAGDSLLTSLPQHSTDGYGLHPGGDSVSLLLHRGIPQDSLIGPGLYNTMVEGIHRVRMQAGLYGALAQLAPFYPRRIGAFEVQHSEDAMSFSRQMWWGERGELGALGPIGEFYRRFINYSPEPSDAWNPRPNNMPGFVPARFHHGDPYMRTPMGELSLPGEAFEKTHPWVKPLKVRGSSIGLSENELIQKWLDPITPIDDVDQEDILDWGSAAHKHAQRQLYRQGMLLGAEVPIYDEANNISGTIDAIVRGAAGPEVIEIKTQGGKHWGEVPDRYLDQLTFYMHDTGIARGNLVFVNRDNPSQVRVVGVPYDERRWENILQRVSNARARMGQMVEQNQISPYESYDLLGRLEVLAKVAPDSREFREHLEYAETSGGFGGFEKQRLAVLKKQAQRLRQEYHTYPYRYSAKQQTSNLLIKSVNEDGTILTDLGTIRLAGVDWDPQAFAYEEPAEVLSRFGVQVGDTLPVTLLQGQFNRELGADTVLPAIIGKTNRTLMDSPYAKPAEDVRHPLDSDVVYGKSLIGGLWERAIHSDNLVNNKLLRVRSPLEQFERGEVFGTDRFGWDHLISNYVAPAITSFVAKNPVTATVQAGLTASLFVRTRAAKLKVAQIAGLTAGAISTLRTVYETISGKVWVPGRYKDQSEFDEYWDALEFIKQSAIAERAKIAAKRVEDVDIDTLSDQEKRSFKPLGPYAVLAIQAERRAMRTMAGFDSLHGSLQDAISSLPRRQQQLAEEIITMGSPKERQRFFELLPPAQRRVLGRFLGADPRDIPGSIDLSAYFKHHMLPDVDWQGWDPLTNMDDLRTRALEHEDMKVEMPIPTQVDKAFARTRDVGIPKMDHHTRVSIARQIHELISRPGFERLNVAIDVRPSDDHHVNLNLDLFHDQTSELSTEIHRDINR